MRIQGPTFVHGAQGINAPHRTSAPASPEATSQLRAPDELTLSPEASAISQLRDVPDIRADRVAELRSQIAAGTYDTEEKMNAALDRLLDEIA